MKSLMYKELLVPLLTRYGTAIAGYIVGVVHADPALIDQVAAALVAVGMVSVDLFTSAAFRRRRDAQVARAVWMGHDPEARP